jgi:hypothetical protein
VATGYSAGIMYALIPILMKRSRHSSPSQRVTAKKKNQKSTHFLCGDFECSVHAIRTSKRANSSHPFVPAGECGLGRIPRLPDNYLKRATELFVTEAHQAKMFLFCFVFK